MNIDSELLEMAAKAADYRIEWCAEFPGGGCYMKHIVPEPPEPFSKRIPWNPLTDDGDALRLAVTLKLNIQLEYSPTYHYADNDEYEALEDMNGCCTKASDYGDDPFEATRRAIVQAAALIGAS